MVSYGAVFLFPGAMTPARPRSGTSRPSSPTVPRGDVCARSSNQAHMVLTMNKSFNVRVHNIFTYMLQILFQYVFHFYGSQMNYVDVSE
jgi:hypothetical protein